MKNLFIVSVLLMTSLHSYSKVMYDPTSKKCPEADTTNRYITVPVIHDLKTMAATENIPNLKLHTELQKEYDGMELNVYYELINKYDGNKETVILIPGGPGQSHTFVHQFVEAFKEKSDFFKKYNVVAMDHRGLGCSRPIFPGHEPSESLTMKFAASDIELIRKELNPTKKIHVWGYSYGSMLAQTYALLYPDSVNKLFLGGAFSAAEDFNQAKRDYEDLLTSSSVDYEKYSSFVNSFPEFKNLFLDYSVGQMYSYEGRLQNIPETLESLTIHLQNNDLEAANKLIQDNETFVMPWMMRSISCIEIFDNSTEPDVYPMFDNMFGTCSEFKGMTDYFNYTQSLENLPMDTFIWGGKFDHVTPAKAMEKMSKIIPNNFLYIDQHVGHGFSPKMDCFINFMDAFFADKSELELDKISNSDACTAEPELDTNNN